MDLEEEKRSYEALLGRMHIAEQSDPKVAEGLRRMREEEWRHRDEILALLIKIDPYSLPTGPGGGGPRRPSQPRRDIPPARDALIRAGTAVPRHVPVLPFLRLP
jgi:hypothetical protein